MIGFIAHVDTAPDMSGKDVKPQIIENYNGGDIRLNEELTMRVADFPELAFFKGHTLIKRIQVQHLRDVVDKTGDNEIYCRPGKDYKDTGAHG